MKSARNRPHRQAIRPHRRPADMQPEKEITKEIDITDMPLDRPHRRPTDMQQEHEISKE